MRLASMGLTIVAALALSATGCGGGGGLPEGTTTGNVTGTILFDGKPVPEGCLVNFMPEGGTAIPAGSVTASDGSFKLRAKGTLDIPTGLYKVVIMPPPPPQMSAEEEMRANVAGETTSNDAKEVPLKYRAVDTTPEVFEVKEGDNSYELDMKAE